MSYINWFENHAEKHRNIVDKLLAQGYDEDGIIDYFCWDNLSKAEPGFCPLFKEEKKCHEMEKLNCYLCACPNFRFDDEAAVVKSWCSIDSRDGKKLEHNGVVHQDCSGCSVPHHRRYVKKHFDRDWLKIMKACHA